MTMVIDDVIISENCKAYIKQNKNKVVIQYIYKHILDFIITKIKTVYDSNVYKTFLILSS